MLLIKVWRSWQTFSVNDRIVIILGFDVHKFSVAVTEFCHGSKRAAVDSTQTNGCVCVSVKFYLWMSKFKFHKTAICHEPLFFSWNCCNHLKMKNFYFENHAKAGGELDLIYTTLWFLITLTREASIFQRC